MPAYTLKSDWQHGGTQYRAGVVETSEAIYKAAVEAGVVLGTARTGNPRGALAAEAEAAATRQRRRAERATEG